MTLALVATLTAACIGRAAPDATGEEIYLQLCANCHGDQYEGGLGPALGPGTNSAAQPDEFLRMSILEGMGRMPSFASSLSPDQVEVLVAHLRDVQGR
jgi:mono/diheme cytochrome c family protein